MKKIVKYLIIPLFSLFAFFLFSSNTANALIDDSFDNGDYDGGFIIPDDNYSSEELYQACHSYITTNIINAESLTEALNGKKYSNFTQEDCMEMINIASKREVIKNIFNFDTMATCDGHKWNVTCSLDSSILSITSSASSSQYEHSRFVVFTNNLMSSLDNNTTYTFSLSYVGDYLRLSVFNSANNVILHGANGNNYITFNTGDNSDIRIGLYIMGDADSLATITNLQLEKGSTATPYVSYDYHREYYEEGIDYADGRVNTSSSSYTQGVSSGLTQGYEKATKDGKSLGTFIPNLLGGFGSFFLTILNIDILGFNLLSVLGIFITILGVIVVIKFLKG